MQQSTQSQDSYADLNITTAWTRAPSFNARANTLSRRGRSAKNLQAKADISSGAKQTWMQAFPETYADEDEQLFKLIMCSPLTSNPIFRGYTGDGRFSLPYSSIITMISTVQDRYAAFTRLYCNVSLQGAFRFASRNDCLKCAVRRSIVCTDIPSPKTALFALKNGPSKRYRSEEPCDWNLTFTFAGSSWVPP